MNREANLIPKGGASVPDSDTQDFGPPGSGSVIVCTDQGPDLAPEQDSDPSFNRQKIKNLDFYSFV
jgi:hypothetical protein